MTVGGTASKLCRPKILFSLLLLLPLILSAYFLKVYWVEASVPSTVPAFSKSSKTRVPGTPHRHGSVGPTGSKRKIKGGNPSKNLAVGHSDSSELKEGKEAGNDWRKDFNFTEIKVTKVNCRALFDNDAQEHLRAQQIVKTFRLPQLPPEFYLELTRDCRTFIERRGYVTRPLSDLERDFPIAFSLLVYKDLEQVERLLRAIYHPQNEYCLHVDNKAENGLRQALESISKCLPNVFLTPHSVEVRWGEFSVLQPELSCMRALWKRRRKWKYYINLTGQEFPLKTNLDLVKILSAYNGANDLEGTIKRADEYRWVEAGPPPHGARPIKGSAHIAVCRGFVDFVLHRKVARDLLNWVKDTRIPDELYFPMLSHNPQLGVPGAYRGNPETDKDRKPFLTRFKSWSSGPFSFPCHGERIRDVCVFGVGDLPLLKSRPEMFANKFFWGYQTLAFDCLEELQYNRTRDQYLGIRDFNVSLYQNVDFAKNHVPCNLDQ